MAAYGADCLHLTDLGTWATWTGSHWQLGGDSEVRQKLSMVCNQLAKVAVQRGEIAARLAQKEAEANGVEGECPEAKRIRAKAAATAKSLRDGTLIGKVLLKLAQEPTIRKMRSDFDQDEMLLACPNLTVDLRDGGKEFNAADKSLGDKFELDSSDLTTHGIVIGMTGSGKTIFSRRMGVFSSQRVSPVAVARSISGLKSLYQPPLA